MNVIEELIDATSMPFASTYGNLTFVNVSKVMQEMALAAKVIHKQMQVAGTIFQSAWHCLFACLLRLLLPLQCPCGKDELVSSVLESLIQVSGDHIRTSRNGG